MKYIYEKSEEYIVKQYDNWRIVRYIYYFKTRKEYANYQLRKNEKLLEVYFLPDEIFGFNWRIKVEAVLSN